MCGISGIISKNKVDRCIIERMNEAIKHRGPDSEGVWTFENVGIGHRRLSILDLDGGLQPMESSDGNYIITYNGEIYNYEEIRNELLKKGSIFYTKSDTEVVLNAYIWWGKECVEHLRGMFAFAVVDKKSKHVFLARDHFGIKPLVYYFDDNKFIFSSEIQGIKTVNDLNLSINLYAIDQYLLLQYIPAPMTAYNNIHKLRPASRMIVSFDNRILLDEIYWKAKFKVERYSKTEDWLNILESTIKESVKVHMISDVNYGAFLSGGIDSSVISTYMTQILGKSIDTFTISFDSRDFDESRYARYVANELNSNAHIQSTSENAIQLLPQLVKHYGEPFADSSAMPTYYVSKLARKHVPMVLSGDGADELFAGYSTYLRLDDYLNADSPDLVRMIKMKISRKIQKVYPEMSTQSWISQVNYETPNQIKAMWRDEYKYVAQPNYELFDKVFRENSELAAVQIAQLMDINSYLPYDILTKVDIASMMNSLEVRTPFIDLKVFEYALQIPLELNFNRNIFPRYQKEGKLLLKKLMEKYYNKSFIYRKKMGFAVPGNEWLNKEDTKKYIYSQLLGKESALLSYFNQSEILKVYQGGQFSLIYQLLFLNQWLKTERE